MRSRARVRAAYATGFGLLIVLLGFIFFFHPGGQMPQDSTHEELKEVSGKNTTNAKEVGSLTKYSIPDAASLAIEKPVPSESARKGSESIVRQKEASVPKETKTIKGASVQGLKTERQAPAGSRASARPAKQTFTAPLRDEMGPYKKETKIDDKGKAASEERGGRMAQTPGFTTGQSGQETTTKDGEEIDPGRVMEWLLERRSDKK